MVIVIMFRLDPVRVPNLGMVGNNDVGHFFVSKSHKEGLVRAPTLHHLITHGNHSPPDRTFYLFVNQYITT
ncbi:hypothetical protein D1872_297100 [compost metagenome]